MAAHGARRQRGPAVVVPHGDVRAPCQQQTSGVGVGEVREAKTQIKIQLFEILGKSPGRCSGLFRPPWAPGWPETESLLKVIANSGVDIQIQALGTHFVAIFRF